MAVTTSIPGKYPQKLVDFINDTVKVALVTSLASYVQDTTEFWSTLSGSEVANGNGYTTGGATVGSKSVNYSTSNNRNQYRAAASVWTSTGAGFSAVGAVYRKDTGSDATSPIVAVVDFGGTQTASNGGTMTVTPDATDGVLYASVA